MEKPKMLFFIISISLLLIVLSIRPIMAAAPQPAPNKHFVLVHGSGHGAWSWYKIVAPLRSSGHNVTAIDLAASGIDPRQAKTLRSISDFFQPLMDLMASVAADERVILVGHSLGGLAISQAMERFPHKISVAVFVTALMPGPSLNISTLNQESFRQTGSLHDSHYEYDDGPDKPPTTLILGPLFLSTNVYQFSPTEDLALATMLMRPLRLFSEEDMSKELKLSSENYGLVKRVFIISEKDYLSKIEFQRWMIEGNPPNQVVEISGSDHMVMMSKPLELLSHLQCIANTYS
ncbi:methylesterase 10-like [Tripterygium wilfordii]|uniref:(S)-hydroxynitrile lyase n=1 Tax=Tripterygium wilfordii TaxID=458696 RepID=A0A7J7DYJ6_TRIWF|nr:salicylic acid-binding protein 2-like [Tripterygium wilfordii]KAF5751146.1 methylesterase 10-like [Tripterygium wilfordii]